MADRDRHLTEAVERFDPKAGASLCSIRAIQVPTARLRLEFPDGSGADARLDAWSGRLRGLVCSSCGGAGGALRWASPGGVGRAAGGPTPARARRPPGRPPAVTP